MNMEMAKTIANSVLTILVPAVIQATSTLTSPLQTVSGEFILALGKVATQHAADLLQRILTEFKQKPSAEAAVKEFVNTPEDEDVQAAFRLQLRRALEANEAFAADLEALLSRANVEKESNVSVTGDRNVTVVDSDIKGTIITGNIDGSAVETKD